MSLLLQTLEKLVRRQIDEWGIVVWYDPDAAYRFAVDRLDLGDGALVKYTDGFFKLRDQLEPWLEWIGDDGRPIPDREAPPRLLVYIPRSRADTDFAIIEAETAGVVMEPGAAAAERNTRLATLVERVYAKVSPEKAGHVARQVENGLLTFEDVEQMAEEAGSDASGALKLIFGKTSPADVLLLFAATTEHDHQLMEKNALPELIALIETAAGLAVDADAVVGAVRDRFIRFLLLTELALAIPEGLQSATLKTVEIPREAVHRDTILHLCAQWRNRFDLQDAYLESGGKLEPAVGFEEMDLPADLIESLETFAAIDSILLRSAKKALLGESPSKAGDWARQRRTTFWSRRSPEIQMQWSLVELAAELLGLAKEVSAEAARRPCSLSQLIAAYTRPEAPWMRLDTLARHIEARYARFDFQPGSWGADWEKFMARCRNAYIATLDLMAIAYTHALEAADFHTDSAPSQCLVFKNAVKPLLESGRKTALLLVDALR